MTLRILITGGAGYLGSVLCGVLLDEGYSVTVVDNLMYGQHSLWSYFHRASISYGVKHGINN